MVHSFPTRRSSDLFGGRTGGGAGRGGRARGQRSRPAERSEEHTSELQSHHPISYAVFCLKKQNLKASSPSSRSRSASCRPTARSTSPPWRSRSPATSASFFF